MNIVYAMTHHVYEWSLPSMRSLAASNPDARVFILCEHDRFPLELPLKAEIINISGQTWFPEDSVNYNTPFKYVNLLKVRYPSILPVDRVIHLDIDTIICGSLEGLWKTKLDGKWFGAVRETQNWYKPFGDVYYNMGVAVINLQQMRKDGIEDTLQEYLNSVPGPWADQDAWNRYAIAEDKAVAVDLRWNESRVTGETGEPRIVHYCTYKNWYTNRLFMPRSEYLDKWRK